jgi:hypothetical protein
LLRDIAWASRNEVVVVSCLREIRSILAVSLHNPHSMKPKRGPKKPSAAKKVVPTWHLSSREQISLLTSVILPLARFNVSDRVAGQLMLSILDILNSKYPEPELIKDPQSKLTAKLEPHPKFDPEFTSKVHGLILQSIQVASGPLCLEILNTAALIMETSADKVPHLLFEVFEAALHSFLTKPDVRISHAIAALQLPVIPFELCVQACNERRFTLCLLLMLEKQLRSIEQHEASRWLPYSHAIIETIAHHVPPKISEYHLFPLWFLALRIFNDSRFRPTSGPDGAVLFSQTIAIFTSHLKVFGGTTNMDKFKSLFANSGPPPISVPEPSIRLHLAARATLLFSHRILQSHGLKDLNLVDELEWIMSERPALLAQHVPFAKGFFDEAETFLSPVCDLASFQEALIRTLAPEASHYLLRFLSTATTQEVFSSSN